MSTTKYSIIALATIAVVGSVVLGSLINSDIANVQASTNELSAIVIENSYTTEDKKQMKKISEDIVEGTIVNKYQIIQYRDMDGNYVKASSKKIAQTEPYIVYELLTSDVIKNKKKDTTTYKFKTFGGVLDGIKIFTDVPEFQIGDKVVVMLEPSLDGRHQEITSGEFGIYKISNGKAKNANSEITLGELKQSLK